MASDITHRPSPLGVPTLLELEEGTSTATYPHLVMRIANVVQRSPIEVRFGKPSVDICNDTPNHGGAYVQHPKPFDADGTLSMACRTLLIAGVQVRFRPSEFHIQMCLVWSPTSCTYVEADDVINNSSGVALPPRLAFETARLAMKPKGQYPRIDVDGLSGITRADCPANATKEELVAQAVELAIRTGSRTRITWSESETLYAELTDRLGGASSRIRPCVVWFETKTIDADPASWHSKLRMKFPRIVVCGQEECILFYPDAMTKEDLIAKAGEIVTRGRARVCVHWSPTESIWSGPPPRK